MQTEIVQIQDQGIFKKQKGINIKTKRNEPKTNI